MKSLIKIAALIAFIIYVFIILEKAAREGGIESILADITEAIGVGAGYYLLFFKNGDKSKDN